MIRAIRPVLIGLAVAAGSLGPAAGRPARASDPALAPATPPPAAQTSPAQTPPAQTPPPQSSGAQPPAAQTPTADAAVAHSAPGAPAAAQPVSFGGMWRLDRSQSELPGAAGEPGATRGPRGGHEGMGAGMRGGHGGGHGARGGFGERPQGEAPGGAMVHRRLPATIQIQQQGSTVSVADSAGTLIQVISTGGGQAIKPAKDSGPQQLTGEWVSGHLEVQRTSGNGVKITDIYMLMNEGRTLKILTKVEPGSSGSPSVFTHVYQRVHA